MWPLFVFRYTLPSSASSTVSSQMVKDSQCSSKRVPSLFRIDGGYCSFVLAEASNPCTVSGYAGVVCSTCVCVYVCVCSFSINSTASKLPIQKCMGKITVQLKSHRESEIAHN